MCKLGIFTWFGYRLSSPDKFRLIREAGFETVLHWWNDAFARAEGYTKEEQAELIRREGLFIENAHLAFEQINDLWLDTLDGQALFERYLSDIDGLAERQIPVAVMHVMRGFAPRPITDLGMRRFRALVDRGEARGVRIAAENVRNNEALRAIFHEIDSPMLGLCYDSGHDFAWSPVPYELLERFGDRLFAVHLHDNHGENDDHLAPGEGKIDWDRVRRGIEASAYSGSLTLESDSAEIPADRTPKMHLKMHYEMAHRRLFSHP